MPEPAPVTTTNMAGSVARMRIARVIQCVDAHAEGEPSRIVVGGVLDVAGDDDAGEDAGAGGRRPPPPRAAVRAARVRAAERRHRLRVRAPGGRRRLRDHGVLVLRGHVGHQHDQHRRRAARDRRDREGRAGHRAGAGGAGRARAGAGVGARGGVVERIEFENVPSFATGAGRAGRGPRPRARSRSTSPTAARSARSWTPPRWGSRSCRRRRANWPSSASGSVRRSPSRSSVAHPLHPGALAPVLRRLRRAAAGRRRRAPRHDRLPRPARPLPRPGTATAARIAVLSARGQMGETYTAESVIDTRFVGRVAGDHAGRGHRRRRAGDQRPRVDHGLPPVRGRPAPTRCGDGFKLGDTWGAGDVDGVLNVA